MGLICWFLGHIDIPQMGPPSRRFTAVEIWERLPLKLYKCRRCGRLRLDDKDGTLCTL